MKLIDAQQQGIAPWDLNVANFIGVQAFLDRYPVTPGHRLYVPEQDDIDSITEAFRLALLQGKTWVENGVCDAYNIGVNMGTAAGQTVPYPHVHLIPRRAGDCADPTGGVRGVIASQQNYRTDAYQQPDPV